MKMRIPYTTVLAAAALIASGATPSALAAKKTVIATDTIRVESAYSNKSARVPVRLVRRDGGQPYWEFDTGGGQWDRCFQNCHEAYRRAVLDFWEEQTEDRNGDNHN